MILLDFEQGTEEWHEARLGIPTASSFHRLVTTTGKASTQLDGYVNELIAEKLMGHQVSHIETYHTQRGKDLEGEARGWFEFHTDKVVDEVGFVLRDDREVGCSPDGLTKFEGLEIKCPKADKHVGHLRMQQLPPEYYAQIQGCLWLCEREAWNFVSYHPELPQKHIRVDRDEAYIKMLESQVRILIEKKMEALEELLKEAA